MPGVLDRVRAALDRRPGAALPAPPPVRVRVPEVDLETRIASFSTRLEAVAGRVFHAQTAEAARIAVEGVLSGRTAIASQAPLLAECGVMEVAGVRSGVADREVLRSLCASAGVGITSADYALADTGTLVMLSSPEEARMISLLPPAHIAVVPCNRILSGLDELFSILPAPAAVSSSMVLITGPSRTADIEQILVRGVHGPGEITVVLLR